MLTLLSTLRGGIIVQWLLSFFGLQKQFIPEQWPEDQWERMFVMAEVATQIIVPKIDVTLFDAILHMFSDSVDELFQRLEMVIQCVDREYDSPSSWGERRREVSAVSIVDYYFNVRVGYREPQEVLEILLEKLSILHYQLESKGIDPQHTYYPYMRKEFHSVIEDVTEVLGMSISLSLK